MHGTGLQGRKGEPGAASCVSLDNAKMSVIPRSICQPAVRKGVYWKSARRGDCYGSTARVRTDKDRLRGCCGDAD